jgi:tRNA(Ile)-lysidine synthase
MVNDFQSSINPLPGQVPLMLGAFNKQGLQPMRKTCFGYNLEAMLRSLDVILQDECQINKEQPVLVAVSGGPDSLCVADILFSQGFPLVIAHFDHRLRQDSETHAAFVRSFASERDIEFILGEGDIISRAKQTSESIEEAARNSRYQFLFHTAEEISAQAVLVGHTANDQVETFLMHLLRGSGLDGLGGMPYRRLPNAWHNEIPLVRPLLGVWREEIIEYCRERDLRAVVDSTNQDPAYFRNRLRLELVPYLENFNPAARKLIWQTAQVLQGERDLIAGMTEDAWLKCLLVAGKDYIAINSNYAKDLPIGMQRHIIRKTIAHLRPELRNITFEAINKAVKQLQSSVPYAELDLISGLQLLSEPGKLWVAEWEADLPIGDWPQVMQDRIALEIGGEVNLPSGWKISAIKVSGNDLPHPSLYMQDNNQVWMDLERIEQPLIIRSRKDGDRFHPFGMEGHSQKLSDFMINQKIPRRARNRWPLVCSGEVIVWVPGYRLAHSFELTQLTKEAVSLTLRRIDEGQ